VVVALSGWFQRRMLDLKKPKDQNRALVFDGVGKYIKVCNFCGRKDIVFPVSSINLCPNCLKKGSWDKGQVQIFASGYCDMCGVYAVGAIAHVKTGMACFKCLWYSLGHQRHALRPDGTRIC
jgi:hypothetical protein